MLREFDAQMESSEKSIRSKSEAIEPDTIEAYTTILADSAVESPTSRRSVFDLFRRHEEISLHCALHAHTSRAACSIHSHRNLVRRPIARFAMTCGRRRTELSNITQESANLLYGVKKCSSALNSRRTIFDPVVTRRACARCRPGIERWHRTRPAE
jgi:hypothetical protein